VDKIDFKKTFKPLYSPPVDEFVMVEVPEMLFVKVDGKGDPNKTPAYRSAVSWLYSISYAMKFSAKAALGKDYVVPPLEGLWWADDPKSFVTREKHLWRWTMMLMVPDLIALDVFDGAAAKASKKLGDAPTSLCFESYVEGTSLQILHRGSYDDEGPVLAHLHDDIMPNGKFEFNGPHHEIYLSDPRKTDASRLKTILRQPVKLLD
jgi:hypothetical protein